MELSKDLSSEIQIGASIAAFHNALDSQKQLLHNQIDQLRTIVVTQCKLTGVNPLSQEMAAGALSINIGKRPRDLLNPKAVKYMQLVFSIKDAISKKESREISARFGLTVTQVREYFSSQRTRVRKMVRLSREKAIIASASKEFQDVVSTDSDPAPPIDPIPLNSVGPSNTEEVSCSNQVDALPGLSDFEKQFVENIFGSMCKEETFTGQVKLMEWILRIENPLVLTWFLNKGGAMMLAGWLSQAATEEQTSVLSVALKVLSHLPLHKAPPVYMPEMLQAINRLRFYGISDVSNRARVLLSKWSKMFSKSQATKKLNGVKSSSASEIDLSQRIGALIEDESWKSSINNSDLILAPLGGEIDDSRKMETPKLLMAPSDDSNKKYILGSSTTYNKERRKVLLVEQPGNKTAGKIQQGKAMPSGANQARPITADEIQKAKIRAQYNQNNKRKYEGAKKSPSLTTDLLSASEAYLRPKIEAQKKARLLAQRDSKQLDSSLEQKPTLNEESLPEKCLRVQIPWRVPPAFQVNTDWKIGIGQHSKEFESQRTRMLREKETIYQTLHDIPPNPKDPWDIEIDFDDTLTPNIPIDQLNDSDAEANDVITPLDTQDSRNHNLSVATPNVQSNSCHANKGVSEAEPDLELLAVLLKNPELVFALTSGQASGLSSEDTVKLLDVLKSSGGAGLLNQAAPVSLPSPTPVRHVEVSLPSPTPSSRYEVSLPSPTPSCNIGPSVWTSEVSKNPFSRTIAAPLPLATTVTASDRFRSNSLQSAAFLPSASTQTPPINHPSMSSLYSERHPTNASEYYLSQPPVHSQQRFQAVTEPYIPVDDSNRSKFKAAHAIPESRAKVGPGGVVGQQWERNDPFHRGQRGLESSSPQKYHAEQGNHRYGHGHGSGLGQNYQDQRGYNGHPSDNVGRYQKSSGYQDRSWRGVGGNRRYDDDRRR